VVDAFCVFGEYVETLNGTGNQCHQHYDYRDIQKLKRPRKSFCPSEDRERGSDNALREYEVDDEEEDDASSDEDLCRNGDGDASYASRPDETHGAGYYSGHAETEEEARHNEFVAAVEVDLEDYHM